MSANRWMSYSYLIGDIAEELVQSHGLVEPGLTMGCEVLDAFVAFVN